MSEKDADNSPNVPSRLIATAKSEFLEKPINASAKLVGLFGVIGTPLYFGVAWVAGMFGGWVPFAITASSYVACLLLLGWTKRWIDLPSESSGTMRVLLSYIFGPLLLFVSLVLFLGPFVFSLETIVIVSSITLGICCLASSLIHFLFTASLAIHILAPRNEARDE